MTTLNMVLKDRKRLSASEFLSLSAADKNNIKETHIIPPRLGSPDFGSIEVVYKTPRYEVQF